MVLEVWVDIPGFPGYEISDLGNVRTFRSQNGRGGLISNPRPLSQDKAKGKVYYRVSLMGPDKKRYHKKVHSLVLSAFQGKRPSPMHDACHLDGNAENNYLTNLYWGTKKDNAQDRIRHGTQCRGSTQGLSKLTDEQVAEIIAHIPNWKRGDGRLFANKFGVSDSTISAVKQRSTWRHLW